MEVILKKIRIGGINYDIKLVHDLRNGDQKLDGWIRFGPCEIMIEDTLSWQMQNQTLLHEVIHGMTTTLGRTLDEDVVDALAYLLLQVLIDNPELPEVMYAHEN